MTGSVAPRWRKSSRSQDHLDCVEAAAWRRSDRREEHLDCVEVAAWRNSSRSDPNTDRVETAARPRGAVVLVRDSKNPAGPALSLTVTAWGDLLRRLKSGQPR